MLATSAGWLVSKGLPRPPDVLRDKENTFLKEPVNLSESLPAADTPSHCSDDKQETVDENDWMRVEFERRLKWDADIVGTWCEYIRWAGGVSSREELLRRACHALSEDSSHGDDVRLLRLWIRHAGHLGEPLSVFERLEREGIGLSYALRYEAEAAALERKHHFEEAEARYLLGLQRKAEPFDRLERSLEEFHARMQKRASRKQKQASKRKSQQASPSEASPPAEGTGEEASSRGVLFEEPLVQQSVLVPVDGFRGELHGTRARQAEPNLEPSDDDLKDHQRADEDQQQDDTSVEEIQAALVLARFKQDLEHHEASTPSSGYPSASATQRRISVTQEVTTSGVRALLGDVVGRRSSVSRRSSVGSVVDFEDPTYTTELEKRELLEMLAHHDTGPSHGELKPLLRVHDRGLDQALPSPGVKPAKRPERVPNAVTASPGGIGGMPMGSQAPSQNPFGFEIFEDD